MYVKDPTKVQHHGAKDSLVGARVTVNQVRGAKLVSCVLEKHLIWLEEGPIVDQVEELAVDPSDRPLTYILKNPEADSIVEEEKEQGARGAGRVVTHVMLK